ncbi:hypothetical protein BDW22DRAFT_1486883 [Trametopsis cervina]|nr:hypothetical protein BDW22DRAFT_1486883 [Trametopsis cervina]
MNAESSVRHPCAVCCMPTTLWCSRCQNSWYCSAEHMQTDWPRHKHNCVPIAQQYDIIANPTPDPPQQSDLIVSALFFHPQEERSRIISVECEPTGTPSQGLCPQPLLDHYFTECKAHTIILTQGLNGEGLRFPLHIWYCPLSLQRGAPINRAVQRITSGAAERPWCGSVIVLKFNGSRRQGYADAGSNDLPALSAYFLAYT